MTYCQSGEYSILAKYLGIIGRLESLSILDIGAADGKWLSNSRDLVENHGATAVLIDVDARGNPDVIEVKLTVDNILDVVPECHYDVLSLDIDGNDYWILEKLLAKFRPTLIIAEFNPKFPNRGDRFAIEYNSSHVWNDDDYYGMSFGAFEHLVNQNNYTVVDISGINAVAIINEELVGKDVPINDNYVSMRVHRSASADLPWIEFGTGNG